MRGEGLDLVQATSESKYKTVSACLSLALIICIDKIEAENLVTHSR